MQYLASGGLEVWLIDPESQWTIVVTAEHQQIYTAEQTVATGQVLPGFAISVAD
ncbi:MAG: hypothetical protein F6J97_08980 [Leptolyngbya sp. SIO4C1]|nr:hypothetical protein [Leptolyngbya sp. SIO4C1]